MMRLVRTVCLGLAVAAATLFGMSLLPHDRYVRWQAMRTEAYARLGWIYERIHFDPTPIDIAFVGTSHTMNGVDAAEVSRRVSLATGHCVNAVNLAVPEYGRSLHWIIARELLKNRPVKVLVLEVVENESRKPHPLFPYVADLHDVLTAPIFINVGYVHDLVRIPFRQLSLGFKSLFPGQFGLKAGFDARNYDGSNVDNTRIVNVGGVAITPLRDRVYPRDRLERAAQDAARQKSLHMLGAKLDAYEYRAPRYYVDQIVAEAARRGVKVVFLYLPGYGKPAGPIDDSLYRGRGPIVSANDVLAQPSYWFDPAHLNMFGAAALTARLGQDFGALYPRLAGKDSDKPLACPAMPGRTPHQL
ncbi:hypothetical protein [Caulobacter sp. S45]|uniref:hypothetical protein n=1 Tax=Caulobacter sp. S45 TaxID=1641861 RepID=UPI00131B7752|nr:hypothetical protein [Caulobacter sp. S45]